MPWSQSSKVFSKFLQLVDHGDDDSVMNMLEDVVAIADKISRSKIGSAASMSLIYCFVPKYIVFPDLYGEIGQVLEKTNHPHESFEMYQKAYEIATRVHDQHAKAMLLGCMGNVLFTLGKESEASQSYRLQLQIAKEISNTMIECKAYHGLAKVIRADILHQVISF